MTTIASETWTGSDGASWPGQWTGSAGNGTSTTTIQGNKGRQTTGAGAYQYRVDRLNVVVPTDFEATINVTPTVGTERYGLIHFRGGATNQHKLNSSYQMRIINGAVEVYKVGPTGTETWFNSAGFSWVSTDVLRFRIFCSSATIRLRWWLNADPEPGTWNLDLSDTTYTGGGFQLSCFNGNEAVADTWDWDDLLIVDFASGTAATVTPSTVAAIGSVPAVTVAGGTAAARRAHTAFSWSSSPPAMPAAATQLQKVPLHNVHMVGFGSGNVNPSPGTLNWTTLDTQVQRMRDSSAASGTKMITLAGCPGWMKTTSTDPAVWAALDNEDGGPVASHYTDFANLCVAVVQRYPDITWFNVWHGMRGFWNSSLNRYNYEGYTSMYNTVYNAVKAVRPTAKIGGPYMTFLTSDGTTTSSDDPPASIQAGRTLTYNENFDSGSMPAGWYANDSWFRNQNGEMQVWKANNVTFSGSRARLLMETAAQHNARVGFTDNQGARNTDGVVVSQPYVCGMIESSLQWTKGLIAVKCNLPKGKGLWPGPWLFNLESPFRHEIDFGEDPNLQNPATATSNLGGISVPSYAATYHYTGGSNGKWVACTPGEHIYATDWSENAVIFYLDWVEVHRVTGTAAAQLAGRRMMILLQTAIGGNFPGPPDASTDAALPLTATFDWVRVWQGSGTPAGGGTSSSDFQPSAVTFTGGVFEQRDLDAITHWKNNAVGFDHITVAGSIENRYGAEFSSTAANQLGKFLVMDQWLRANVHASKPIFWAETYLHKAKTVGGLTQTQLEDLWFTMLTAAEAGVAGEIYHSVVGEFPTPIVYQPQPVEVNGSTNRFNSLVTAWEGTSSQSASVSPQPVAAVAGVGVVVLPVPATVVAGVVAAQAAVSSVGVVVPGSAVAQPATVAAVATIPASTISALSTGIDATVTPATVAAVAGGMEIETKGRRTATVVRRSLRYLRWWNRSDGGLWP